MPLKEFVVAAGTVPSAVLIPGWATDSRVFGGLFPDVAAVRVLGALRTEGFVDRLAAFLGAVAAGPVTIVGWSLGGFLAAEFAGKYPSRVRRLVLIGVRLRYPPSEVEPVRSALLRDRQACLSDFYARCFFPSRMKEYRLFRSGLQEEYFREMDKDALLSGLDYLERVAFPADSLLPSCPVKIIHGE
ncbi:MAG: alpha/beta hydrolase, partial [Polyangiaceae bacterium]|nr:alpha/beta hydrolase [Polyangiaceae bacterium]